MFSLFKLHKLKQNPLACIGEQLQSWQFSSPGIYLKEIEKKMRKKESEISNNSSLKKKAMQMLLRLAPVAPADVAKNSKAIVRAFPRFIVGLVLLAWVAPQADVFYTRFDFHDRVSPDVWYYESWNWFFLCLGPYIKSFFTVIGLYLCLVYKPSLIKSSVAVYAMAYDIGKICWLVQVKNHDEYNAVPSDLWIYSYGIATSILIIVLIELLTYWFNHRTLAIKARLQGLRNIADKADPQVIVKGFVQTMDDDIKVTEFVNY